MDLKDCEGLATVDEFTVDEVDDEDDIEQNIDDENEPLEKFEDLEQDDLEQNNVENEEYYDLDQECDLNENNLDKSEPDLNQQEDNVENNHEDLCEDNGIEEYFEIDHQVN